MTYEVGLLVATDRFEVERLGRLAFELDPVVPWRCILFGGNDDAGREVEVGVELVGAYECRWLRVELSTSGLGGNMDDDTVLE